MTFPSKKPPPSITEPISESTLQWNIRERLVMCPMCKYNILTELAGPKCGTCNSSLITVIKTEHSELAR